MTAGSTIYGWMTLAGIGVSIFVWSRLIRRDDRLVLVYVGGLAGAFVGAKLVYLAAEGWLHWHDPSRWLVLATGKSITGALLGGYAGVEIAKPFVGYRGTTGDRFAIVVPIGVMLGRIGCLFAGCCLGRACGPAWFTLNDSHGVARWPAVPVEFLFNAVFLGFVLWCRKRGILPGQHFHLYLMAYGIFRFGHEFLRDTPVMAGAVSGYQIAALGIFALGAIGFVRRQKVNAR